MDGSPLKIQGCITINLLFVGHYVATTAIVVSPLTTEAIFGLDFLREHQAHINLPNHVFYLKDRKLTIPL